MYSRCLAISKHLHLAKRSVCACESDRRCSHCLESSKYQYRFQLSYTASLYKQSNSERKQTQLGHEHIKVIQLDIHQRYKQETLKQRKLELLCSQQLTAKLKLK